MNYGDKLKSFRSLDAQGRIGFIRALANGCEPSNIDATHGREPSLKTACHLGEDSSAPQILTAGWSNLFDDAGASSAGLELLLGIHDFLARQEPGELCDFKRSLHVSLEEHFRHSTRVRQLTMETPYQAVSLLWRSDSVHPVHQVADLDRRLTRPDRRIYALFDAWDRPLVYLQLALTRGVARSIDQLLHPTETIVTSPDTVVFYSICRSASLFRQLGLARILIARVMSLLREEFEGVNTFVTISPIDFRPWVLEQLAQRRDLRSGDLLPLLTTSPDQLTAPQREYLLRLLPPWCAEWLCTDGRLLDRALKFHCANGARFKAIYCEAETTNWNRAWGMMSSFEDVPGALERNAAFFREQGIVQVSPEVEQLRRDYRSVFHYLPTRF